MQRGMESERTCRLCTRDVSDSAAAIHLYSSDSVERGVADKMATLLEVPLDETEGLGSYICELCNARFNHLVRSLEVHRLNAKKNYEKQAKKAGIYVESKFCYPLYVAETFPLQNQELPMFTIRHLY